MICRKRFCGYQDCEKICEALRLLLFMTTRRADEWDSWGCDDPRPRCKQRRRPGRMKSRGPGAGEAPTADG